MDTVFNIKIKLKTKGAMISKILISIIILIVSIPQINSQEVKLKNGDFLFQDLNCGPLCDAIENATFHHKKYKISHMGVVSIEDGKIYVIEAYKKVQKTPLKDFLNRSLTQQNQPKVIVGRLKPAYQSLIPAFLKRLYQQLGKAYDTEFKLFNHKYYCSELVYENLLDRQQKPILPVKPMSFKNKLTQTFDSAWIKYFKKQNLPIPEGQPGCNPADYMLNPKIQLVYFYY